MTTNPKSKERWTQMVRIYTTMVIKDRERERLSSKTKWPHYKQVKLAVKFKGGRNSPRWATKTVVRLTLTRTDHLMGWQALHLEDTGSSKITLRFNRNPINIEFVDDPSLKAILFSVTRQVIQVNNVTVEWIISETI